MNQLVIAGDKLLDLGLIPAVLKSLYPLLGVSDPQPRGFCDRLAIQSTWKIDALQRLAADQLGTVCHIAGVGPLYPAPKGAF